MKWLRCLTVLPALTLIAMTRLYQMTLSHLIGRQCRFHPTCSQYLILAVRKYGAIRGAAKGIARISHCHPWHPGGVDWP